MFRFSSLTPYKGEIETVQFTYNPIRSGRLGIHKDASGKEWDVNGFQGIDGVSYIIARPLHASISAFGNETAYDTWYDTSGFGNQGYQRHRWIPYRVEVIDG